MKKLTILLGGLALLGSAHAEVLRYDFTALIDHIWERGQDQYPGTSVSTSTKAGVRYSIGDSITGYFEYDTATGMSSYQPSDPNGGGTALYNDVKAHNGLTATTSTGIKLPSPTDPILLQVSDTGHEDYFSITSSYYSSNSAQLSSVLFSDQDGSWLHNTSIPSAALLKAASYAVFNSNYYFFDDSGSLSVNATITSLKPITAVPEPSTCLMLLTGLASLAYARRRSKIS